MDSISPDLKSSNLQAAAAPDFCSATGTRVAHSAKPRAQGPQLPECSTLSPPPWTGVLRQCARADSVSGASRARTTIPRGLCDLAASETKMAATIILPILSPYTKYSIMINKATPYTYPVPLRDDGNMPDVPSHPQDPQGPSLEWLKKL
uniref:NADH dehydrogenase [ubiquinone] 1 alpha subcomplex subunit 3 n=1 Tax=Equus caballus TaxID=9796 RepID=A0A9L0SM24_HORSE